MKTLWVFGLFKKHQISNFEPSRGLTRTLNLENDLEKIIFEIEASFLTTRASALKIPVPKAVKLGINLM